MSMSLNQPIRAENPFFLTPFLPPSPWTREKRAGTLWSKTCKGTQKRADHVAEHRVHDRERMQTRCRHRLYIYPVHLLCALCTQLPRNKNRFYACNCCCCCRTLKSLLRLLTTSGTVCLLWSCRFFGSDLSIIAFSHVFHDGVTSLIASIPCFLNTQLSFPSVP
jgi:hypothetical protein